jgi:tetratricopeptide (TPR) repeat protein
VKHQTHLTPLRADALVGLGRAQLALGQNDEAVKNLEAADSFWRQFDHESRWGAEAALWLGRVYLALSRPAEAERSLQRARQISAARG